MVKTDTVCKNCLFAQFADVTQVNCGLGLLTKYEEAGIKIQEAYDHEKEFYIIPGKFCSSYRTINWEHQGENLSRQQLELNRENQISYLHIVHMEKDSTLEELYDNIKSVVEGNKIKPELICIIKDIGNTVPNTLISSISESFSIPWMLRIQANPEINDRFLLDSFLLTYPYKKYQYYIYSSCSIRLNNFVDYLNYAINNELFRFGIIHSKSNIAEILVVNKLIHTYLGGNKPQNLEEKIGVVDEKMLFNYLDILKGTSYENFMSKLK
jgi:hypothetical protein